MANSKTLGRCLIIDDEVSICESLKGLLEDEHWEVKTSNSGETGIEVFKSFYPDVVILDIAMPGMDGIEVLQYLKSVRKSIPVIMMSGHGTIETAVKTTRLGALDFIEKPISADRIFELLSEVSSEKISLAKSDTVGRGQEPELVGKSLAPLKKQLSWIAPRHSWVLLNGENGTGKDIAAQYIHWHSSRHDKPFIPVNCAAIPDELIESELFGHVKGAFTGAIQDKRGKFELAHTGTLFLDEVGDMSLKTQAKVLRVLQEQYITKIGDEKEIKLNVRVIAATNKDLDLEIREGRFRMDLYYRLNVIPIFMPPLRDRVSDLKELSRYFLEKYAREFNIEVKYFSDEALKTLKSYSWPGNVRELKNLIERLCIMCHSIEISMRDLLSVGFNKSRPSVRTGVAAASEDENTLKQARLEFEKNFILDKLKENDWNVSKTADIIGIERSNLHKKLKTYKIDPKNFRG